MAALPEALRRDILRVQVCDPRSVAPQIGRAADYQQPLSITIRYGPAAAFCDVPSERSPSRTKSSGGRNRGQIGDIGWAYIV